MRRAATEAGLDADECIVEYTIDPIAAEQAESTVEAIVAAPDRASAIVCVNDQIAFAVLRALAERQVRVPRDISVVGYDDVDFAAWLSPTLTSIRQPKYELGRAAARLLLAETADPLHRHDEVRFEPELVERQSTTFVAPREAVAGLSRRRSIAPAGSLHARARETPHEGGLHEQERHHHRHRR